MDFAALVEAINALLDKVKPGMKLPDDTTEETINLALSIIVSAIGGDVTPEAPDGTDLEAEVPGTGIGMNNRQGKPKGDEPPAWARLMMGQMTALSNTVATLQSGQKANAEKAYTDRVIALCNAGMPAKEGQRLTKLGKQYNWDMGLLPAVADDVPGKIPKGGAAKTLANAAPPKVDGLQGEKPTDDDCRATAAKVFGVAPAKKA